MYELSIAQSAVSLAKSPWRILYSVAGLTKHPSVGVVSPAFELVRPSWRKNRNALYIVFAKAEVDSSALRTTLSKDRKPVPLSTSPLTEFIHAHLTSGCKGAYIEMLKSRFRMDQGEADAQVLRFEDLINQSRNEPKAPSILAKYYRGGAIHIYDGAHRAAIQCYMRPGRRIRCKFGLRLR